MDQTYTPPGGSAQAEPMSFTDKLVNIFASPGELYENVRLTPVTHGNWLIPTLILVVVGALLGYAVMTNPSLSDQFKRMASQEMEKAFEKQVQQGKMTAEQVEQAREQAAQFGSIGVIMTRIGGAVVGPFITLFLVSLVYWLLGKGVMKAVVPYWKVAEVVGLAFFITVLDTVVTTILMFGLDQIFAVPSLSLLIPDFSIENKFHLLAASMNIFTFWNLGVIGIGLSRIFQRDFPKVLVLVVALWLLWTLTMVFGMTALRG